MTLRPLLALLLLVGCGEDHHAPEPSTAPAHEHVAAHDSDLGAGGDAEAHARAAMQAFGKQLKGTLLSTMQADGPAAAVGLCSDQAQPLALAAAAEHGVLLGRTSLRLRNPDNAGPAWVTEWLAAQKNRSASEVTSTAMTAISASGAPVVRVVAPLAIEAPCLVCHGPAEGRDPALAAVLAERYPGDQGSGYALGDLRGAIWAEAQTAGGPSTLPPETSP